MARYAVAGQSYEVGVPYAPGPPVGTRLQVRYRPQDPGHGQVESGTFLRYPGAILTGILATDKANPNLISEAYAKKNGLAELVTQGGLLGAQLKACAITIVLSVVATAIIAFIVKAIVGLRPTPEVETAGLDVSEHGEEGYII